MIPIMVAIISVSDIIISDSRGSVIYARLG